VAVAKILASALCIGTGGSAGREGPIVQVGAALGSTLAQLLKLSDARIRNLVACGAAAGIAATFNAPIAGVAFAIEVLMAELQIRSFGNVVIAAVSAAVVSQLYLGDQPAFIVPTYELVSVRAIALYLVLGLLAAFVGVMFIRMLAWFEDLFDTWRAPAMLKPAAGALLLGLLGYGYMLLPGVHLATVAEYRLGMPLIENIPHVYGSGFTFIEQALQGRVGFSLLFVLVFLKPLATSFTLGSGNSGGVFAPSLFIGAVLGGALGHCFERCFPGISGPVGSYALVGMAAVFAAAARAPLTAMLIVFEMSNDYQLILPLMLASVTASSLAQFLFPESIYTIKLSKRGIRFVQGRDMDIMQAVTVREVMNPEPVTVRVTTPVTELYRLFQQTHFLGFPVLDEEGRLWGMVSLQDLERCLAGRDRLPRLTVADIASRPPITVYEDEPIWTAIQKMAPRDLARLPVLSRDGRDRLVGLISRSDILRAYDIGIVRKQRGQLLEDNVCLRRKGGNGFAELMLREGDHGVGRQLAELALPLEVHVVAVDRGGEVIIPHGNTRLAAGDVVTLFGRQSHLQAAAELLTSGRGPARRTAKAETGN